QAVLNILSRGCGFREEPRSELEPGVTDAMDVPLGVDTKECPWIGADRARENRDVARVPREQETPKTKGRIRRQDVLEPVLNGVGDGCSRRRPSTPWGTRAMQLDGPAVSCEPEPVTHRVVEELRVAVGVARLRQRAAEARSAGRLYRIDDDLGERNLV